MATDANSRWKRLSRLPGNRLASASGDLDSGARHLHTQFELGEILKSTPSGVTPGRQRDEDRVELKRDVFEKRPSPRGFEAHQRESNIGSGSSGDCEDGRFTDASNAGEEEWTCRSTRLKPRCYGPARCINSGQQGTEQRARAHRTLGNAGCRRLTSCRAQSVPSFSHRLRGPDDHLPGGLGSSVALGSLTTRHSSWHREQDGWGLKTVALEFFPESSLSSSRLMS